MHCESAYIAPYGFEQQLYEELTLSGRTITLHDGRLMGTNTPATACVWAQNTWLNPIVLPITSISDAAKKLKSIQRNWAYFPTKETGRAKLIQELLPKVSAKPHVFGTPPPTSPLGGWTLLDKNTMLASSRCTSPFPNGACEFLENKTDPPSRAYLKLWDGFTRFGISPGPGDLCVELGSAPGGWTWVLESLGARVFSIDRADLIPQLMRSPLVEHCRGSAYGLEPETAGAISWLFSDLACYPEKLLDLVHRWLDKGQCQRFFCTIKFAGPTNFSILDKFLDIPHSTAAHLYANKHEVTWIKLPPAEWFQLQEKQPFLAR